MVATGGILALDIASRTGWAFGRPGELPRAGSVRLAPPGSDIGLVGMGLIRWMRDFTQLEKVDALYIEAPVNPAFMRGKTSWETALMLISLFGIACATAEGLGIFRRRRANVQDVRRHFVGESRPKDKKQAVIARCRQLGWKASDDNAADALALWSFACAIEAPRTEIATTPLFAPSVGAE